jgi:hypothetical protein
MTEGFQQSTDCITQGLSLRYELRTRYEQHAQGLGVHALDRHFTIPAIAYHLR